MAKRRRISRARALRELTTQTRLWAVFQTRIEPGARKLIRAQITAAASGYGRSGGDLRAMDAAVNKKIGAWERFMRPHYLSIGTVFGERARAAVGFKSLALVEVKQEAAVAGAGAAVEAEVVVSTLAEYEASLSGWIRTEGLKSAKRIAGTTKADARDLINRLRKKGKGSEQIARELRASASRLSPSRAHAIARTETHSAASFANQEATRTTGIEMTKTWIAHMVRTRDTHIAANGQQVALDEPYTVGFGSLMYPGDSTLGAPAEEVINCRCGEIYQPIAA